MAEKPFLQLAHGKFSYLLISLIVLLLLFPIVSEVFIERVIFDVFLSIVLLSAVYTVSPKKHVFTIALLLSLPTFAGIWSTYFLKNFYVTLVGWSFAVAFFGFIGIIVLSDVLKAEKVTTDTIYAAICVYLLIGVTWALLYSVMEGIRPESFVIAHAQLSNATEYIPHFLYYSFVTLTTLGFGDITPITPAAKSFSYMEAVTGQIYVAVLIARLVGLHIAYSMKKDSS